MDAIIALYSEPTAQLTEATIHALQAELGERLSTLEEVCGWSEVAVRNDCAAEMSCGPCRGVTPMQQTFEAVSDDSNGSDDVRGWIRGLDGFMRVTRICPGWTEQPTREASNGYTELAIGFTKEGLDPIFGGQIVGCRFLLGSVRATLEGDLNFAFEERFRFGELPRLDPIVQIRGRLTSERNETAIDANFRVSAVRGADLSLGFEVADAGTMVATVGSSGLGVQAENGRFSCELIPPDHVELSCEDVETGETVP
jgi:hypothetical protein